MEKLSLELKKIERQWYEESLTYYIANVYDCATKQPVTAKYANTTESFKTSNAFNLYIKPSGLALYNVDDETKLIIKYTQCYDNDIDDDDKLPMFPYEEKNGEIVNSLPLEKIFKNSEKVEIFTNKGNFILEASRDNNECGVYDFNIKLNKNTFTLVYLSKDNYAYSYEITKSIYNYNGNLLFSKSKEISNQDIITKNLDEEENIK